MQRIGVLGASFNPPTLGHRDVVVQAASEFDEIILVPSVSHAFGKSLVQFAHRLNMLALFVSELPLTEAKPKITISTIEESLLEQMGKGPIYTYDVLTALSANFGSMAKLRFIIGPDNHSPLVWQKFYRYQEIEKQWPLFIAKENLPIHSTMVREACLTYAHQDDIRKQKLIALVGEKITDYIEQHQLYREREKLYG